MSQQVDVVNYLIREIVSRASAVLKDHRHAVKQTRPLELPAPPLEPADITASGHQTAAIGAGMAVGSMETALPGSPQSLTVSDTLAAFTVRSVVLDPKNSFNVEHELNREEVERLIQLSVEAITETESAVAETIKMQVYFDTNFPAQVDFANEADFLHRERQLRAAQTVNFVKEICESKVKSVAMLEVLYRKIVSYVLIKTKMGAATDIKVVRETTGSSTPLVGKETQLNGLSQLVAGIRLFNRALGKGGEGIDAREFLHKKKMLLVFGRALKTCEIEPVPELCGAEVGECLKISSELEHKAKQTLQLELGIQPVPPSKVLLAQIISSSTFRRQLLIYVDAVQKQLRDSQKTLKLLGDRFQETVAELKAACRARTAVPVDQVYPHFLSLASLWSGYRDELFLIAFRRGILDLLHSHSSSFTVTIPLEVLEKAKPLITTLEPSMIDDEKITSSATLLMTVLTPINREIQVLHPSNTTSYHQIRCEMGGFCPVTLVDRAGLVVPGDRNLGLVRYRDKCYAFAKKELVEKWAVDPEKYIQAAVDLAKRQAPLIQLCHLYHYFPTVDALEKAKWYSKAKNGLGKLSMVAEVGTQVDTHIMDTNIDPKYQWNEWELRRRALVLVNLKTKRTHSTQTVSSTFRRDSETQHYEPKASSTQTVKSSATQVVHKKQYLAGLRGDGTKKFTVVDLTLNL
ncbi:hypothetical protein HDU93_006727 [Gonapodya sp. JEL0774]|nr:hypothetical protein HDU93_006727 [Gonapodya sp. JEL0774]